MSIAARQWTLERAVQAAIAVTIVLTVLASGSIQGWVPAALALRWAALAALVALALAWAWRRRGTRLPRAAPAAAGGFLALALFSAAWSAAPGSTLGRAVALAFVLAAAALLAWGAAGERASADRLLDAVVGAAALVAFGGLLVLLFRYDRAVAPATTVLPARYQGLGGGPNTATMLLAVALPPAAYVALESGTLVRRLIGAATAIAVLGSIVASGSRGALLAGFAGLLAFALLRAATPRRATAGVFVAALFAVCVLVMQLPQPAPGTAAPEVPGDPNPIAAEAVPPYVDANLHLRLQDDVGRPSPGVGATEDEGRRLLGSSGRLEAWAGAVGQARDRPLLGYGFGTEGRVFVDRYVGFNSGVPENSYVGLLLQLGVVGLAALLAVAAAVLVPALRAMRRLDAPSRALAAACIGALVAGLVLGSVQSFVYAAGNNATLALWICAFLVLVPLAGSDEQRTRA